MGRVRPQPVRCRWPARPARLGHSAGFAGADFVWDAPHLEVWLTNPQAMIKGTVMTYRQADPSVRQTIIDWLKEKH